MNIPLRIRKSAGIRVTPATHRLIRCGDAARSQERWGDAAAAFQAALTADPRLPHIRLQLGHMLKEAGAFDEADAVYAEAARLSPDDAEPVLHRAHLAKRRHRLPAAIGLFIAALARSGATEIESELRRLLDMGDVPADILRRVLLQADYPDGGTGSDAPADDAGTGSIAADADRTGGSGRPLIFDITDLVGHFRYQRLPTGIQRVQIEVLDRAIQRRGANKVMIGCFVSGRSRMMAVPVAHFATLATLARQGGDTSDPAWQEARAHLFVHLAFAGHMKMPFRAVLINLGTSLWVADYFLFIRNAKAQQQISYIPFVHDLIPIMVPDFCVRGIREEFAAWLAGLFQHADGFLTNSRSTARDLLWSAGYLGHTVTADRVEVVTLDGDFRTDAEPLPASALNRWGLEGANYALMVSTIEPRKNHVLAFDAWAELIRCHGAAAVPRLVCVGRNGWLNEHVFARLAADPALIAGVTIIHSVSDAEMALLYRCSLFTVYPSHYEGWGLPITESLCHGKVAVIADNSSLPEAGGGFALTFDSGSLPALVGAVERVAFDTHWRHEQEARITVEFIPRPWERISTQIIDSVERTAGSTPAVPAVPTIVYDAYYAINLHRVPMIWPNLMSGEIFRIGDGWLWPEADRCRSKLWGAELHLRLISDADGRIDYAGGALRLYLRLRGLASIDCPVTITIGGRETKAVIAADQTVWVACHIPEGAGPDVSVIIRGQQAEEINVLVGGRERTCLASLSVVGMMVSGQADEAATRRVIQSIESWR